MKNALVTPSVTAAPAGWYNDPLGIPQLRWWNGIGWTNHVQENRAEFSRGALSPRRSPRSRSCPPSFVASPPGASTQRIVVP